MQDLANHSEAQQADADYMEKAGLIHAKFSALQGKDRVDAFPQYMQDLKDERKKIGDGLSNDMSRKLFDSQSLSTMGRSIFNGAGVAADANKQYAINANESQIKQQRDLAATSNNPADVEAARGKIKQLASEHAALLGQDPVSGSEYERTINSSLDANNIKHMARTDPIAAGEELEKRRSRMTQADYEATRNSVDNQNRAVGSVNIAQSVIKAHTDDDGNINVGFEQLRKEAENRATRDAPNDALMTKHTEDALRGLYNQKIYADKQFRWENTQTVDAAIQNGVKNIQELRADPKVAAAIDGLPKSEQLKLPARINAYNAARDKVWNQEAMTTISGLRNNDVEAFLNLNPADPKLNLAQPQQQQVLSWQRADKKNQNGDPRVSRALTWLRDARGAELAALGVYHRDSRNPDDYDHMTGTLQSALDLWAETKGKPATYDEVVNTIGPQVIKSRAVPGWLFGTNNQPFFKPDVNSEEYKLFKRKAIEDVTAQGQPEPTEAEIDKAYTRVQLMKLYPPKMKATPDAK
jgi:hypothetical protein